MAGFAENLGNPVEAAFAAADPDPFRDLERQSIARIRFTVCLKSSRLSEHLETTAKLSLKLAEALGLGAREKEKIWYAASVHDIGKIGIDPLILDKQGGLTRPEFTEIQSHTVLGHRILAGIGGDIYETCAEVALSHHERWDGGGYPNGTKGEQIPLPARIVSIADVYDCITAGRPYRAAETDEIAIAELKKCAGTQFDPELVDLFINKVDRP